MTESLERYERGTPVTSGNDLSRRGNLAKGVEVKYQFVLT